jgi:hypothetical protein
VETATRRAAYPSESLPAFTQADKEQEGCSPFRERETTPAQSRRALTRRTINQAQFKAVVGDQLPPFCFNDFTLEKPLKGP